MNTHAVQIDRSKSLAEQPGTGHNRWNEGIPPILPIQPGDQVGSRCGDSRAST